MVKENNLRNPLTRKEVKEKECESLKFALSVAKERPTIALTEEDWALAFKFAVAVIKAKKKEYVHQKDPGGHEKRFMTGPLAEIAVEKWLKKKFRDTSVGNSRKYGVPDMRPIGIECGVKGVEWMSKESYGKSLVVPRKPKYNELCVVLMNPAPGRPKTVKAMALICGVAEPDMLERYSSDSLIYDKRMLDRKTGYYGLDKLWGVKNITELKDTILPF